MSNIRKSICMKMPVNTQDINQEALRLLVDFGVCKILLLTYWIKFI